MAVNGCKKAWNGNKELGCRAGGQSTWARKQELLRVRGRQRDTTLKGDGVRVSAPLATALVYFHCGGVYCRGEETRGYNCNCCVEFFRSAFSIGLQCADLQMHL